MIDYILSTKSMVDSGRSLEPKIRNTHYVPDRMK
jgi:hypothetical protein